VKTILRHSGSLLPSAVIVGTDDTTFGAPGFRSIMMKLSNIKAFVFINGFLLLLSFASYTFTQQAPLPSHFMVAMIGGGGGEEEVEIQISRLSTAFILSWIAALSRLSCIVIVLHCIAIAKGRGRASDGKELRIINEGRRVKVPLADNLTLILKLMFIVSPLEALTEVAIKVLLPPSSTTDGDNNMMCNGNDAICPPLNTDYGLKSWVVIVDVMYLWTQFVLLSLVWEVIFDLCHYSTHRMMHASTLLYKYVHRSHHKYLHPSMLSTFQQNPIDLLLSNVMPSLVASYFIRLSVVQLHAIFVYKAFLEIAGHR
jgi:hypothetical protein